MNSPKLSQASLPNLHQSPVCESPRSMAHITSTSEAHSLHLKNNGVRQTVSHLDIPPNSPVSTVSPNPTPPKWGSSSQRPTELMSRLYDRPENSEVVRMMCKTFKKQISPKPPIGRSEPPGIAIRTMMMPRDAGRRRSLKPVDDQPELNKLLQRYRKLQDIQTEVPQLDLPRLSRAETDDDFTCSPLSDDLPSGDAEEEIMKKVVSFHKGPVTPVLPRRGVISPIGTPSRLESPKPINPPSPDFSHNVSGCAPERGLVRTGSGRQLPVVNRSATQQDPRAVLTYLQKNVYEDTAHRKVYDKTAPQNDNFLAVLLEMRERLGWINELPRHGPGYREKLSKMHNKPTTEDDVQAAVKAKDDDGKFIYALPRNRNKPRARYNPYDLQVVSAHAARTSSIYYTASASNVNRVVVGADGKEETTRTSALEWMCERRLFNMIYHLPVFAKFRIWRAFHTWQVNIRGRTNGSNRVLLYRTLFAGNEVLQGCLLHVRRLCEVASGSLDGRGQGEAAISLVILDTTVTLTLEEFMTVQSNQLQIALKKLQSLQQNIIDIVFESCATVAEMEGITQGIRPNSKQTMINPIQSDGDKSTITKYIIRSQYGNIPIIKNKKQKSNKPSFAEIAEWRKILHRLTYFLRSVDYLILELLRRLVVTATRDLTRFVTQSFQNGMAGDLSDQGSTDSEMISDSDEEVLPSKKSTSSTFHQKKTSKNYGSSPGSQAKSSQHMKTQLIPGYEVPCYDFTKTKDFQGSITIDQVLDELNRRGEVTATSRAILSVQLVLQVPPISQDRMPQKQIRLSRDPADNIEDMASNMEDKGISPGKLVKKAVKFTEDESEGSDGSNYGSEFSEEEPSGNRFAYSDDKSESERPIGHADVVLEPSDDEIRAGMKGIVSNMEATVGQIGSLLKETKLAPFYSRPKYDLHLTFDEDKLEEEKVRPWPDTKQLFGQDAEYQGLIMELIEKVNDSLDMVANYLQDFWDFCTMVDRSRQIDVDSSMAKKKWSTDEFQHVLSKHTDQVHSMSQMPRKRRLGVIKVLSEAFCESCLPYPHSILQNVCLVLPVIAFQKNTDLLNIIKGASRKLGQMPTSVEEFVEHLSFLGKMSSEMPALDREYNVVHKMYTIAREFDITLEPEQFALYQILSPSFQHLKSVILFAEAKKDDNIRNFSTQLNSLIADIRGKITYIKNLVQDPVLLHTDTMPTTALEKIHDLTDEVTSLTIKARSYGNYQERFGSSLTQSTKKNFSEDFLLSDKRDDNSAQEVQADLSEIERDLTLRHLLWDSLLEWDKLSNEWTSGAFDQLNVDGLQKNVNRFTQTVFMLEKGLPHNELIPRLKEKVLDFKQVMPSVVCLRNPSLKTRHWDQIENLIGKSIMRNKELTLGDLLEMNLSRHKDKIQDISTTASNEATLERMLQKVIDLWQSTTFRLVAHSSANLMVIAGADDIVALLEESQVTIGTIRGSRYVTPIKGAVEEWDRRLALFARTLEEWMICQRNWLYLEQIFNTPDIQRQLPTESKLFGNVNKSWKDIMRRTEDNPNALKSATAPGIHESLQAANTNLEKIYKCLEDYLETKRLVFPRFYFLSNDELLDILAQSKNTDAVQPHLGKCFGNISNLEIIQLPRQPPTVKAMLSAEGESVSMPKNVRARGPVEQWLGGVETGMFDTVKKHLKQGLQDRIGISHEDWVLKHPGQIVLTVEQIIFSKDMLVCFSHSDPCRQIKGLRDQLIQTLNSLAGLVSTNLAAHKRLSVNALLTIDVHNRDILNNMIQNNIVKRDDFEWTRQLRYEWEEQTNNCNVIQSNVCFVYGYEYLGCSPRLVMTPLTDRCYLTLTGALHLHLGGSPAGPAGTGKTETCKDLAKAMGKQCVVFNCSEGLNFKMLGKFFSGLCQSGSWICFDEFNRIDIEVLSVVAQQIHTIKAAKDQAAPRFMFEGRDIKLNPSCGFFITMNPSYAGRVDLPDNLKSLFRSVAMMVPDYALIAEIMLFSEGFTSAKSLSTKIVNMYQLASLQLSQQDHYDFGMRAIKSVLVMAGQRKRQLQLRNARRAGKEIVSLSEEEESHILIHALRDANVPKFLADDVPLFDSILADLFPGIEPPDPTQDALEKAISMAVRDLGLQHWPSQIKKVKQLHSQIVVRNGVMLVGPTGGGKTTIRNILQRALVILPTVSGNDDAFGTRRRLQVFQTTTKTKKGQVETFSLNPKCVRLGELYGETDPNTFEWSDGLIASAVRKFAKDVAVGVGDDASSRSNSASSCILGSRATDEGSAPTTPVPTIAISEMTADDTHSMAGSGVTGSEVNSQQTAVSQVSMDTVPTHWHWLILDGPVDTLWVENLNTVLDDSKILCLANGERISLTHGMRLLFEVDDLSRASPATVSRCAMVYMDPVDLGWKPYVKTWINRLPRDIPETGRTHLQALFDLSIERGLEFIRQYQKYQLVPVPEMSIITCLCNLLYSFIDFLSKHGGFGNPDKDADSPPGADSEMSIASRSSSRTGSRSSKQRKSKRVSKYPEQIQITVKQNFGRTNKSATDKSESEYFLMRNPGSLTQLLGKLFVFAYTWSFGGCLSRQDELDDDGMIGRKGGDRKDFVVVDVASDFDVFTHEVFETDPPLGVRLPSSKSIYSYFVDMDSGNFTPWDVLVPKTKSLIEKGSVITIGETMGVSGDQKTKERHNTDLVPTVDTVRYSFLIGLLLINKCPVLLTGESGTGKTYLIKHLLRNLVKEGGTSVKSGTVLGNVFNSSRQNQALLDNLGALGRITDGDDITQGMDDVGLLKPKPALGVISTEIQFSAQTSASRIQQALTLRLIKKGRDTLGAPKGKKVLVFVDDLNMPAPEQYGSQPPLELLRQYMDLGGFYDSKKLVWKDVLDVTVVAACGPPSGGRHHISPRLLKHFCILSLPQPSTRSLQHIYQVQLGRFFQYGEFPPDVKEQLFSLVSASIAVYYKMLAAMKPTPTKIHYTFNVRDLSQLVSGLMQAEESVIVNRDICAQLFSHEAARVFEDRLVTEEDKMTFATMLADVCHDYFKVRWTAEKLKMEPVLFADFLNATEASTIRVYKPVSDGIKLTQVLEELYMRQHIGNSVNVPQLVFFKDAVEHILRATRIFRQPGEHMLLVGLDGVGKTTTIQLAAYVAGCTLLKVSLHRNYGTLDFREDLKKVCTLAGVKNQNTVFLLTDGDIVKESFLEDINCMLNSGEVPDLYDNEEMDGIAMELKLAAAESAIPDTRSAVYQFFIQRVKKNLHIVLAMSPAGSKFRQRCRANPSLINCCTIDWYSEWDKPAMLAVANVYFQRLDFVADNDVNIKELKAKVATSCVDVHFSIALASKEMYDRLKRQYYITPSSYMELIRIYSNMLTHKKDEFINNRKRLLVGLSRLSEANTLVGIMQEELVNIGPKIEEKARDTERLLIKLKDDQEAADQVHEIIEKEENVMKKETQIVQEYADECQRDLASVIPILHTAIESLDSLNKADISEVRMYLNPPELVGMVLGAVCILMQMKPDWATAKQLLGDSHFLKKLINFDKNAVPEKVFTKLKKYSTHPDFNPAKVERVSRACTSMCMWVLALEHYHQVYKMAKPKQARVEEAKEALKLAQDSLAKKQASLSKIQNHLKMLQDQYADSVRERESLKERKTLTALRIKRASVLISALSDEKLRWRESVSELDFKLNGIVGDTLISAAAVAYIGAFTKKFRKNLLTQWADMCREAAIPVSEHYNFVNNMADASQILQWQNEGLPQDNLSTENAIIAKRGRKWPLMIDPQGQAISWIRQMEGAKLKVVQASDPNYMRMVERAIRVGDPILLEEVSEILDPSLKPILMQETFVRGGNTVLQLGDTEIEYNNNFRLYMCTKLSNPDYLPAICIKVSLINFTVTFSGIQEQLLSSVVKQERPQLEMERNQLLENITADLHLLRDLEDKSLSLLQNSQGHILDDEVLVEILQKSKGMYKEIRVRIMQTEDAEKKLNLARKRYLPVAARGAVLYFVLANLAIIDVMYQFSLSWFHNMFISCIGVPEEGSVCSTTRQQTIVERRSSPVFNHSPSSRSKTPVSRASSQSSKTPLEGAALNNHMRQMMNRLTLNVYNIASMALFAKHKLMFSFMLCCWIMRSNDKILKADMSEESKEVVTCDMEALTDLEGVVFLQGPIMASMIDKEILQKHDGMSPIQRLENEGKGTVPSPPRFVTSTMWQHCQYLEEMFPVFNLLCPSLINNHDQWNAFHQVEDPYEFMKNKYPDQEASESDPHRVTFPWETFSGFQRLLIILYLHPSALIAAVYKFVVEQMGPAFVQMGTVDLRRIFDESDAKTPIIFILSPGSDPGTQLLRFARELRGTSLHVDMISLGRGQGPKAEELIQKAQILKGRWIFLQNCHLAASWMPKLQNIVDSFNKPDSDVDPQFRLWLSSKPDPSFPISILQTGLKMTVEPPRGVKANLLRSFGTGTINEKFYEETCPDKPAWKTLLFSLCFFNAVIHERKKYGHLGWNIPYEFNDSDLEVSVLQLEMLLDEHDSIPWPALWYLTGEVTYGGRVTDNWDMRCLHRLLQKYYHPMALEPGYFYTNDKLYHPISGKETFDEVRRFIEQLPTQDSSDLFGMNENAERSYLESQAHELVSLIVSVQPHAPTSIIGGGRSSDEIVISLAKQMMENIPQQVEPLHVDIRQHPKLSLADIIKISAGVDPKLLKKNPGKEENMRSSIGAKKSTVLSEGDLMAMEDIKLICQSALFTVLRQEIYRFNHLIQTIHTCLRNLLAAIRGELIMSEDLDEAYDAMLHNRVPQQWKQVSYESCKPLGAWTSDLIQRVEFFSTWAELVIDAAELVIKNAATLEKTVMADVSKLQPQQGGLGGRNTSRDADALNEQRLHQQMLQLMIQQQMAEKHEVLDLKTTEPRSFWLPAFFFPQGFLTAVLQNHARKLKVSVDSLSFIFNIVPSSSETDESLANTKVNLKVKELGFSGSRSPDDGVLVFGLYLDGACWNHAGKAMVDAPPGQRLSRLPEVHFLPTLTSRQRSDPSIESTLTMFSVTEEDSFQDNQHHQYECPLYRTSARAGTLSSTGHSTNFVTTIMLPSKEHSRYWVMRGVALLCQQDD